MGGKSSSYSKILIALDLRQESRKILKKAFDLVSEDTEVKVVYVVEPMSTTLFGGSMEVPTDFDPETIENIVLKQAVIRMNKLLKKYPISNADKVIHLGNPVVEIKRFAKEFDADLIVLGTHGQKGIGLIFGSTANGVLHGSPCDVLCVQMRLENAKK